MLKKDVARRSLVVSEGILSICRNLHIINEESEQTTFQISTEESNIDLTIVKNQSVKEI
jgi:hypothetical protein